jgi:arylsulfatase A-like enzyme
MTLSHVLLLSIDGMHEVDLQRFIAGNPGSALGKLSQNGIQYESAYVNRLDGTPTNPSDSFPGLLALVTGGSSRTHGGWYDDSYARDLFTDSTCTTQGTAVAYDETIELDNTGLWGNGKIAGPTHSVAAVRANLNPNLLPWRKTQAGCTAVFAHDFIRTNTLFEVAHEAGMHTAWSDKHLAYEMVSGPSGSGVDDFFAPEINSLATNLPMPAGVTPGPTDDFTTNYKFTKVYDDYKVQAILNQIDGKWSDDGAPDATGNPGVPAIFGMNFQAVSVAQKDARPTDHGGYLDAQGTPNSDTADALSHTDASIGKLVAELDAQGLLASTLIIVTAKHGQSPIDHSLVVRRDADAMASIVNAAAPVVGHIEDDVALYWLKDPTTAAAGAAALWAASGGANDPALEAVYTSANPGFLSMFGDPASDPHTPDLVLKLKDGAIYSLSTTKWAEHGGFADDDAHVALLVANPALAPQTVAAEVKTQQVAPTILQALCLDPTLLIAVQKEGTPALPNLAFSCPPAWQPMRFTADTAPTPVTVQDGPWTLTQLAASGEMPPLGQSLVHKSFGYCNPFGPMGVRQSNPGVANMAPFYFPMVIGSGLNLQGFFDWRPKDINEGIIAAQSSDGGRTWIFQQDAYYLTEACPTDDTQTNPNSEQDDNGFGHPYIVDTGGVSRLYVLDRSDASVDNLGLIVTPLQASRQELEDITDLPLSPAPKDAPLGGAGLTRTVGLQNPDGILGVVPGVSPTTVLYVQKQVGAATSLPAAEQCPTQPYAPYGAAKPKAPNTDVVTIRLATTTDGVNFKDLGAVNGLNAPTTVSYLGTRWIAPSGTLLVLDATHYGLFFSGGNCMDADSDSFHYIGYAESTDLMNWTIINGINNPIASLPPEVLSINGVQTLIPSEQPVVGPAQPWYLGRVYSPSVTRLDSTHVTMTFAGYEVQSPTDDLLHYRQIGHVVLNASRPLL